MSGQVGLVAWCVPTSGGFPHLPQSAAGSVVCGVRAARQNGHPVGLSIHLCPDQMGRPPTHKSTDL